MQRVGKPTLGHVFFHDCTISTWGYGACNLGLGDESWVVARIRDYFGKGKVDDGEVFGVSRFGEWDTR